MVIGTPCNGPKTSPRARARSASAARDRAPFASTVQTAFSAGLCLPIRERYSSTRSAAEKRRERMPRASSAALEKGSMP
jgi:hypothetical protein